MPLQPLFTRNTPFNPTHLRVLGTFNDPKFIEFAAKYLLFGPWKSNQAYVNAYRALKTLNVKGVEEVLELAMDQEYSTIKGGHLYLYQSLAELQQSVDLSQHLNVPFKILSDQQCIELDPSVEKFIKASEGKVYGLWYDHALTAEPTAFASIFEKLCIEEGVQFKFGQEVKTLVKSSGDNSKIEGVRDVLGNEYKASTVVVACGSFTPDLLKTANLNLPIYPLKGHSLTLTIDDQHKDKIPKRTVSLARSQVNFSPIPGTNKMRVSGFGDFTGYAFGPSGIDKSRIETLVDETNYLFPWALPQLMNKTELLQWSRPERVVSEQNTDPIKAWSGLRPFTPDSNPFIGKMPKYENLYVNAGHGMCGWMMSSSSGKVLASIMNGTQPYVDPAPYSTTRFQIIN
jgi:D-amino-acid dehydrogenase